MIQLSLPHHTTDLIEHFAGLVKIVAYPDSTGFEEQEEMESTVPVVMLVKWKFLKLTSDNHTNNQLANFIFHIL